MTRHRILSNDAGQAVVLAMRPAARTAVAVVCFSVHAAAQEEAGPAFPSDDPVIRSIWEEGVERSG